MLKKKKNVIGTSTPHFMQSKDWLFKDFNVLNEFIQIILGWVFLLSEELVMM